MNKLETIAFRREFLPVKTLTVDDCHRVKLPEVEPGQVFAYEPDADGTIKLVPVVTQPGAECGFAKLTNGGGRLIFKMPDGFRLAPEAIAEERESRA